MEKYNREEAREKLRDVMVIRMHKSRNSDQASMWWQAIMIMYTGYKTFTYTNNQ